MYLPQPDDDTQQSGTQDLESQAAANRAMYINSLLNRQQDAAQQQAQPSFMQPPQPQQPPPANNAENAGPVKAGLRSVLSGVLKSFSYNAGQSMIKAAGGETDAERATRLAQTGYLNAQTDESNQRAQLYGIQSQIEQRKSQLFNNFFSGNGLKDPTQDLGPLAPYEQAQLAAAKDESAMKGDLEPFYNAVKDIRSTRAQHQGIPLSDLATQQINSGNTRRWQLLHPGQDLPDEYTLQSGSTDKDATRVVGLLDSEEKAFTGKTQNDLSNLEKRSTIAKNNIELQKLRLETNNLDNASGIAFDPQNKELVQTTATEAQQKGLQGFTKATGPEFDKYRSAQAQFNDVQTNTSRYTSAASRALSTPPTLTDLANIHSIMNQKGLYDFNVAISGGGHIDAPVLSGFLEGASRAEKSGAYHSLSPQAKDLVDGYFRTVTSIPAYMKALTNSGKFSQEQLDLEMQNIPNPTMDPRDIARKLGQWQENIDQGSSSIPRMLGMPTTRDIRAKYEGQSQPTKFPNVDMNSLRRLIGQKVSQ